MFDEKCFKTIFKPFLWVYNVRSFHLTRLELIFSTFKWFKIKLEPYKNHNCFFEKEDGQIHCVKKWGSHVSLKF
jgi:hypothetical protein